jgi:hypothetical protein
MPRTLVMIRVVAADEGHFEGEEIGGHATH